MTAKTAPGKPHARKPAASGYRRHTAGKASVRGAQQRTRRRLRWLLWGLAITGIVAVVAAMMWSARSTTSTATRPAPDFTLTDTNGKPVHLADLRGHPVVLYFSEGAGCQSCLLQMAAIEKQADAFRAADLTVLPIVMNTAAQIRADMAANKVTTPFLIDTGGTVSAAYGTLGKGMHAGLPGHSFVLIDRDGVQRWYGEYPSMYLSPTDLLTEVQKHL